MLDNQEKELKLWKVRVILNKPFDIVNGGVLEYLTDRFSRFDIIHSDNKVFTNFDYESVPGYLTCRLQGYFEASVVIRKDGESQTLLTTYMPKKSIKQTSSHDQEKTEKGLVMEERVPYDKAYIEFESIIKGMLNSLRKDGLMNKPKIIHKLEGQELKPWEKIPDHYWDRQALKMWWDGYTNREIGNKVSITRKVITNRICHLRNVYGEDIVPYKQQIKQNLIKKEINDTG